MNRILTLLLLVCSGFGCFAQSYKFISAEDGLSNSLINKIIQDQYGFVWIATEDGLNCFDGNRVKVYRHNDADSNSLANNFIRDIFIDSQGRLLVGTYKGVQVYNPLADNFSKPARRSDGDPFHFSISSFIELSDSTIIALGDSPCTVETDRNGNIVVKPYILPQRTSVHPVDYMVEAPNGSLFVADNRGGLIRTDANSVHNYNSNILSSTLFKNKDGDVFACTSGNDVCKYNAETDSFECVIQGKSDMPYFLCRWLGDDKILACTDGNGLKVLDLKEKTISHYSMSVPFLDDSKLKVHSVFVDKSGNIWLGLYQKGVLVLNPEKTIFNYLGYKSATDNIIGQSCVSALCFCNGMLWVATDNDGIYVTDIKTKRVVRHLVGNNFPSLIVGLCAIDDKYVYVGSYGSGLWKIDTKTFEYKRIPLTDDINRLHFSRVANIARLDENVLVIASLGSGVGFVDIRTDKQIVFKNVSLNANLWSCCVEKIGENSLAVGSYNGIYFIGNYNKKAVFKHIFDRTIIFSLLSLDENRLAAATSDGLYIIKGNSDGQGWGKESIAIEGASSAAFYSLTKDSANNIWAGSDNGLYRITTDNDEYNITRYSTSDGTVNGEFAKNAVCRSNEGIIYFGGFDGITYFNPKDIRKQLSASNGVKITRFWVRNREINPSDSTLNKPIISIPASCAREFVLQHNQNSFTIEFTPVDFFSSPNTHYYYTVNNDAPVRIANDSRQLSFIRLIPDVYQISLFSITDGVESPKYTITVTIMSAWYHSLIAKILYIILGLTIVLLVAYMVYRHKKSQQEIDKHRQAEIDNKIKLRFFTNLIHEIRTPMSLIVSPLQKVASTNQEPKIQNEIRTICLGVDRMRKLVDSLLDMRKIDNGKMSLELAEYELIPIINNIIELFALKAESKNISLTFKHNLPEGFAIVTDSNAVDKIITNLISNAMKFCREEGAIEVSAQLTDKTVEISVSDCGPGINNDDIDKIFNRFYQADSTHIQTGTGIGLHLAKSLAQLLGGTLSAHNKTDAEGAVFTFAHPLNLTKNADTTSTPIKKDDNLAEQNIQNVQDDTPQKRPTSKAAFAKKRIFLVEDDPDVAEYLISELRNEYLVTHFSNGAAAMSEILYYLPDLVITDIMMPELDGYGLCKRIKQNINSNEIPVIIITAKTGDDVEISSLQAGADAFISKPFNIDVLKQTIKNLITVRHKLIVNYSGAQQPTNSADLEQYEDPEEKLLKRIVKAVEKNISNAEYSTEMLAADVGLSRVHLYRKLKDLTNQSGSEFIRNIRLKRASELILNRKGFSIAEVADMVGFPNTAYFCTAFRNFFGTNPTAWREQHSGSQDEEETSENS